MPASTSRFARAIKFVKQAEELARSGALVLDDGVAAIYFLWGQPSHAYIRRDDELIEGEAALKEIALDLSRPGKVEWNNKDVLQIETLRCNADDLIHILESMATAGKEPPMALPVTSSAAPSNWDGAERRQPSVPLYNLDDFPLLPQGPALWADVPTSVVHLDVLLGALPTVLITFEGTGVRAAGLVFHGELFDAIVVRDGGTMKGRDAWNEIIERGDGAVSAYEIDDELAEGLPILWRSQVVHSDLDSRWFDAPAFLESQRGAQQDRAVIVNSAEGTGIGIFLRGRVAGAYTTQARAPVASLDPLARLLGPNFEGSVMILERIADDAGEPFIVPQPAEAPVYEPTDTDNSEPIDDSEPLSVSPVAEAPEESGNEHDDAPVGDTGIVQTEEAVQPEELEMTTHDVPPDELAATATEPDEPDAGPTWFGSPATSAEPPTPVAAPAVPAPPVAAGGFDAMAAAFENRPAPLASPPSVFEPPSDSAWHAPAEAEVAPVATPSPDSAFEHAVTETQYDEIITELLAIGERFLGRDFASLSPIIENCAHTPQALRVAIASVRDASLPDQPPDRLRATARAMQLFVSDRVTAA